jgi:TRAP-type transport system small permease protein
MSGFLNLFDRTLAVLAGLLTAVLLLSVMGGVVSRAVNRPFSWTDELSSYLMVWLACLGWMIATRRGGHIRIRVVLDRLSGTAFSGAERVIQMLMILFGGVIAWKSLHLIWTNADIDAVTMPISTAWMYAPLLPAGLVTMLQALAELRRPKRPATPETSAI